MPAARTPTAASPSPLLTTASTSPADAPDHPRRGREMADDHLDKPCGRSGVTMGDFSGWVPERAS